MSEYKKVPTVYAVWKALKAAHPELKVFSSYSAPDGDQFGNPNVCRMMTEYGFNGTDFPIMGAETTWDRDSENPHKRPNEQHKYWLCVGKEFES